MIILTTSSNTPKLFYDHDIQLENISIQQVTHQLKEQITPLLPRNTQFVFSNTVTPSTQIAIHSNLFFRAITNIINMQYNIKKIMMQRSS